jgi:serine/threonine protein kinase
VLNKNLLSRKKKGFHTDSQGNLIVDTLLMDAMREVAILKKMNHMNIMKLFEIINDDENGETFLSKKSLKLVIEYCRYGPILTYDEDGNIFINKKFMTKSTDKYLSEWEIRDIVRDVILGLDYCIIILI